MIGNRVEKQMKLYHASQIDNQESIEEHGLAALVTDKVTSCDEQIREEGVFLFSDLYEATQFGYLNWDKIVVYEVSFVDGFALKQDPEYDEGVSWFHEGGVQPDYLKTVYKTEPEDA